jgi:hypothetical protein
VLEAGWGVASAADRLAELERDPGYRVSAWRVRMVCELMQGNHAAAAGCRRTAELLLLEDGEQLRYGGTTARIELFAFVRSGDVVGVKRCMERIEQVAERFPRWLPDLYLARFHYRRLQGDRRGGLEALLPALQLVAPGRHLDWMRVASAHVQALCDAGQSAEAVRRGLQYLAISERERLTGTIRDLQLACAEAMLAAGQAGSAAQLIDACLADCERLGVRGVVLGSCYGLRARAAAALRDARAFAEYARRYARECKREYAEAGALAYRELARDAEQAGLSLPSTSTSAALTQDQEAEQNAAELRARLLRCEDASAIAREALQILVRSGAAAAGHLYGLRDGALVTLASAGAEPPPPELAQVLRHYLHSEAQADELATQVEAESESSVRAETSTWTDAAGRSFLPLLLGAARTGGRAAVGVAALHYPTQRHRPPHPAVREAIADALLVRAALDPIVRRP